MCANEPQQLPKTSKFYSRCKKCDIEKSLGGWCTHPPLVAQRLRPLPPNSLLIIVDLYLIAPYNVSALSGHADFNRRCVLCLKAAICVRCKEGRLKFMCSPNSTDSLPTQIFHICSLPRQQGCDDFSQKSARLSFLASW